MGYRVTSLGASTWDAFAELVERNNGVYGGCWVHWLSSRGRESRHLLPRRKGGTGSLGPSPRRARPGRPRASAGLGAVRRSGGAVGDQASSGLRQGAAADSRLAHHLHLRRSVAPRGRNRPTRTRRGHRSDRPERGGGLVEAISEVTDGREAKGRFLFSATVEVYEDLGFHRVRKIGKHAWIVSRTLQPTSAS